MVGPWTLDRPRTEGVASPVSTALGCRLQLAGALVGRAVSA